MSSECIDLVVKIITCFLGVIASIVSIRNSKKIKELEKYKHEMKKEELKIEMRYKQSRDVMLEVHVLLTNIGNLSCTSECYLFRDEKDKQKKYEEVVIEARNSFIWVQRQVNVLSVYMNRKIYEDISEMFKKIRGLLEQVEESNGYDDLKKGIWCEPINEIENMGQSIIAAIQQDSEDIVANSED